MSRAGAAWTDAGPGGSRAPGVAGGTRSGPTLSLLLAACVLVPLWVWSPFVLHDVRLDAGLLAPLVLAAAVFALARGGPRWLPGTTPFLLAVLVGLLALARGPQAQLHGSLAELPPFWGGMAERAPLLGGWILACAAASDRRALRRAAPWILAGIGAASGYGLLQILGLDPLGFKPEPHSPPTAPFSNTNTAAELLAPALVAGAARLPLRRGRRWLWPGLAALALMSFQLGHLGVLAARLSVAVGLAWLVLAQRRRLPLALLLVASFALGEGSRWAGRPAWAQPSPPPAEATAVETGAAAEAPRSARIRWLIWSASLQRVAAEPLGIGLGRFDVDYPFWRPPEELRLSSANFTDPATPRPATPHCEPLLALVECGWLGAALLGIALWRLLRRVGRAAWTSPALAVVAVHALVRSPLSDNPTALALAALLVGWSGPIAGRPRPGARGRWLLLALAALPLLAAPSQVVAELSLARRFRAIEAGREPPARAAAVAVRWRPWDATAWALRAAELGQGDGSPAEVREALRQALAHDPADLFALTALFKLEMLAADRDESVGLAALGWAERIAPEHPVVRQDRTVWLAQQADRFQQTAQEQALAGNPASLHPLLQRAHLLRAMAAARRSEPEAVRESLLAAAFYSGAQRLRLERFARGTELDEGTVRELVVALLPDLEPHLGPPPRPRP